jgi:hypothetical protein
MEILEVSCTTGEGLPAWQSWLESRRTQLADAPAGAAM